MKSLVDTAGAGEADAGRAGARFTTTKKRFFHVIGWPASSTAAWTWRGPRNSTNFYRRARQDDDDDDDGDGNDIDGDDDDDDDGEVMMVLMMVMMVMMMMMIVVVVAVLVRVIYFCFYMYICSLYVPCGKDSHCHYYKSDWIRSHLVL